MAEEAATTEEKKTETAAKKAPRQHHLEVVEIVHNVAAEALGKVATIEVEAATAVATNAVHDVHVNHENELVLNSIRKSSVFVV